ncbi:hypothetical protein RB595_005905 [Gaeumannomyces hyphopodioides]
MFATKRKPRAIRTFGADDDDDEHGKDAPSQQSQDAGRGEPAKEGSSTTTSVPVKFTKRPFKHSSLRKSINVEDVAALASDLGQPTASVLAPAPATAVAASGVDDDDGPVVVKPSLSRSGSAKQKKKRLSSRLSFGGGAAPAGDDDGGGGAFTTPKKSGLSSRALENSALRNRLPIGIRQPAVSTGHAAGSADDDDSRPRYSKEYLDELASSTPNTPRDISTLKIGGEYDEAMELDLAELDGALVVPSAELSGLQQQRPEPDPAGPAVLTEAEIRERKERRARLAQEEDFMSLDGSDEDGDYISLRPKSKKKDESRLVAEDEDLGEGYEEFVEDGGLSLGKKAERDARRRRRAEMAELIDAAEGDGGDGGSSDGNDSEAERRAAYEEAQTRAGMDGLQRRSKDESGSGSGRGTGVAEIPRLKPLPDLGECLAKMREVLQGMERDAAAKHLRITELEKEKSEIAAREAEVQTVLDQEGKKYHATPVSSDLPMPPGSAAQSPLRPLPTGFGADTPAQRGLESFGTPTKRPDAEDAG